MLLGIKVPYFHYNFDPNNISLKPIYSSESVINVEYIDEKKKNILKLESFEFADTLVNNLISFFR